MIKSDLANYIYNIDNLRNLVRYQTAPRVSQETVAEHSFFVAAYVLKLNDYYEFDLLKALQTAILHDFSEVFISDVPHPIKKAFPLINDELNKAENEVNKKFISEEFSNNLEEFNNLSSPEGIMVALGDILSVVSYSKYEITLGNSKYMKDVLMKTTERYLDVIKKAEPYLKKGVSSQQIVNFIENFKNK
jgi:5'-deoxynucleotidase YfbR-like HD superfamily hydrolase